MSAFEDGVERLSAARLPSHLYVHVPFCASKCAYCDFTSVEGANENTVRVVFRSLRAELLQWERSGLEGVLETVYVGGGTPSLAADEVIAVLDLARDRFIVRAGAEITVEGNPDSLSADVVRAFVDAGVTRVSVGVQSFCDRELRVLGRVHDAERARRACRDVVGAGAALSVDLICGIPGQSRASWSASLQEAVDTGAEHVSVYPLSIEDGTPMQVGVAAGLLEEVDSDTVAEQLLLAENALGLNGFERYEVANYARGHDARSIHNSAYWTGRSYIGIGPGAHTMLDAATARESHLFGEIAEDVGRIRVAGSGRIEEWLLGEGRSVEKLSASEAAREDAMLGMRLRDGIDDELVRRADVGDALESLRRDGLVEHEGGRWRTTGRGWLLGNEVFGRIWTGP